MAQQPLQEPQIHAILKQQGCAGVSEHVKFGSREFRPKATLAVRTIRLLATKGSAAFCKAPEMRAEFEDKSERLKIQ
ncbi:MAG TPA: hypothetical protein VNT79_18285 [Phycisphaerae bacterium]|nr:hypothetical protein [Phycisphaerae bacterium]